MMTKNCALSSNQPAESDMDDAAKTMLQDQKSKPRLYLEPLTVSKHLEAFHELWTYEEALAFFPFPVKKNVDESREFLEKILPNQENPDIEKFALILIPRETTQEEEQAKGHEAKGEGEGKVEGKGEMIGFVGTNRYKESGMEVGYVINRRYWGKGFATEGLKLFLDMYWKLPQRKYINRLVAKTNPRNLASQNILIKCGARRGETLKDVLELWVDREKEKKTSDLICWFLDRPGVEGEELEVERRRREDVLKGPKEDSG